MEELDVILSFCEILNVKDGRRGMHEQALLPIQ
jgi:hypothetical protein